MRALLKVLLISLPIVGIVYLAWIFSAPLRHKPLDQLPQIAAEINGRVPTLTLFTDYRCPGCRQFHTSTFNELKARIVSTGKANLQVYQYPLHPEAAELELIIRDAILQSPQLNREELSDLVFGDCCFKLSPRQFAELLAKSYPQLNQKRMLDAARNKADLKEMLAQHELARAHGVMVVPSIALNGKLMDSPYDIAALETAIVQMTKAKVIQ